MGATERLLATYLVAETTRKPHPLQENLDHHLLFLVSSQFLNFPLAVSILFILGFSVLLCELSS